MLARPISELGSGGYLAGTWSGGALADLLPDDVAQRNVMLAAFRSAANAASSVSWSFARKDDAVSRRFYAKQAQQPRKQLD